MNMGAVAGEIRAVGHDLLVASLTSPASRDAELRGLRLRLYRLEDALIEQQTSRPLVDQLITLSAFLYEVRRDELVGPGRLMVLCRARFAVVYAALRLRPDFSTPRLGAALGDRDHSTIVSAHQKAMRLRRTDQGFRDLTDAMVAEFAASTDPEGESPWLL